MGYAESRLIVQNRANLGGKFVMLLPEPEQKLHAAQQEARWLADTAYKAAAAIARLNHPRMPGWLNNRLVNSNFNLQERGLCWHYEHDMYRELRRRKLHYFRVGCCVRDQGRGSEHNCVYITARNVAWPHVIVLDAWRYNGRLKIIEERDLNMEAWQDDPVSVRYLSQIYTECHPYPIEHWARVKSGRKWNDYVSSWSPEGTASRQGMLMQYNMYMGLRQRDGKLTNY